MFLDNTRWRHSVKDLLEAMGLQPALPESPATVESIRQAMLDIVNQSDTGTKLGPKIRLTCRIGACRDAQGLWYLRSEIMQMLSASQGEREARHQLDAVSALFKGLLPESLSPRPAFHQDDGHSRPARR